MHPELLNRQRVTSHCLTGSMLVHEDGAGRRLRPPAEASREPARQTIGSKWYVVQQHAMYQVPFATCHEILLVHEDGAVAAHVHLQQLP